MFYSDAIIVLFIWIINFAVVNFHFLQVWFVNSHNLVVFWILYAEQRARIIISLLPQHSSIVIGRPWWTGQTWKKTQKNDESYWFVINFGDHEIIFFAIWLLQKFVSILLRVIGVLGCSFWCHIDNIFNISSLLLEELNTLVFHSL